MKVKISLFNRKLLKQYLELVSAVGLVLSLVLIFVSIPDDYKGMLGIVFVAVLIFVYLILWVRANNKKHINLKVNNSTLEIKTGDIFEENALKVIAFNEYFDTQVDNKIISENTLNGKFINDVLPTIGSLEELEDSLQNDERLKDKAIDCFHNRKAGKKTKYRIGTIHEYNGYLITAFSKFDVNNRAYLSLMDYTTFLMEFWNEIDILYNGRAVAIPLMGSGITRFKDCDLTEQELLEILIWSFKVSKVKFTYPSKVIIVIHESKEDKINFYELKEC